MLSGCEFLGSLLAIIIKAAGITSASANARVPPPRRSAEVFLPESLNVSECVEGCACGLRVRVACHSRTKVVMIYGAIIHSEKHPPHSENPKI